MKNRNLLLIIGGIGGVVILVCMGCFALVIINSLLSNRSSRPVSRATERVQPIATIPPATATVAPSQLSQPSPSEETSPGTETLSFSDIVRNPEDVGWTDVQFDEYKKTLNGLNAEGWSGNIAEVKQAVNGDYYIEIDMPGTEDTVDVFLYIEKDIALSLSKGQQVTFAGIIDGLYPNILGDWSVEVKGGIINNVTEASAPAGDSAQLPLPGGILNFSDIVRNPESVGWTDVQFDEYKMSIKGMRAENWQGTVVDVKESLLGDYYIEVDMSETEDTVDIFLYTNKDLALSLGKGQQITFTGVVDGLYPDLLEDHKVEIREATIR